MGHSVLQSQQYAFVNVQGIQNRAPGDLTNTMSDQQQQQDKQQAEKLINRKPECFKRVGNLLIRIKCPDNTNSANSSTHS